MRHRPSLPCPSQPAPWQVGTADAPAAGSHEHGGGVLLLAGLAPSSVAAILATPPANACVAPGATNDAVKQPTAPACKHASGGVVPSHCPKTNLTKGPHLGATLARGILRRA